jgi:hypothetical protein
MHSFIHSITQTEQSMNGQLIVALKRAVGFKLRWLS